MWARELWLGWLFVLLTVATARAQDSKSNMKEVDYCQILNCFQKHIACNNSGKFSSDCPKNSKLVDIKYNQELILLLFNRFRNSVAGGESRDFYYAIRMAEMQWNDELAYLAELNVKTCQYKRDRCRSTKAFPNAGQTNAFRIWRDNTTTYSDKELIKSIITDWLTEIKYSSMFIMRNYPKMEPRPLQYHFAIAVNQNNAHIGCAGVRFYKNNYNRFVFTCNFATRTFRGGRVYNHLDESKFIAIKCKNGTSVIYPNLCSSAEVYEYVRMYETRPQLMFCIVSFVQKCICSTGSWLRIAGLAYPYLFIRSYYKSKT